MEQQLSESLKAILLKIALELKKLGWKPDAQSNEIDVFQGHLSMSKEWDYDNDSELPAVNVVQAVDMSFSPNEQNGVNFLIYKAYYQLFVEGAGGNDTEEDGDLGLDFTDQDANNLAKIQTAAKQIDQEVGSAAEEKAYAYANESYSEWKHYHSSGAAGSDREEPWKDQNY